MVRFSGWPGSLRGGLVLAGLLPRPDSEVPQLLSFSKSGLRAFQEFWGPALTFQQAAAYLSTVICRWPPGTTAKGADRLGGSGSY